MVQNGTVVGLSRSSVYSALSSVDAGLDGDGRHVMRSGRSNVTRSAMPNGRSWAVLRHRASLFVVDLLLAGKMAGSTKKMPIRFPPRAPQRRRIPSGGRNLQHHPADPVKNEAADKLPGEPCGKRQRSIHCIPRVTGITTRYHAPRCFSRSTDVPGITAHRVRAH